jgi:epoxyqueuosine reductase
VFSGSPIKRIGRNRMVRNAAIAAGNSGDQTLVVRLALLVHDADDAVREAASWALAELSASA